MMQVVHALGSLGATVALIISGYEGDVAKAVMFAGILISLRLP